MDTAVIIEQVIERAATYPAKYARAWAVGTSELATPDQVLAADVAEDAF